VIIVQFRSIQTPEKVNSETQFAIRCVNCGKIRVKEICPLCNSSECFVTLRLGSERTAIYKDNNGNSIHYYDAVDIINDLLLRINQVPPPAIGAESAPALLSSFQKAPENSEVLLREVKSVKDSLQILAHNKNGNGVRWLYLKQAAVYSGIGRQKLVRMIKKGTIKGFQDPDDKREIWLIDKKSLDEYRTSQASNLDNHRQKALDILASAGFKFRA
jgi:hypothetical protein